MPLITPNVGEQLLLKILLQLTVSGLVPWELRLWKNDYVPVQGTTWANLTEATFGGYSPVTLDRAEWTDPVLQVNKAATTYGPGPTIWTVTAGNETIYGYAIVDPTNDMVFIVERFAGAILVAPGGQLGVWPRVTLTTDCGC